MDKSETTPHVGETKDLTRRTVIGDAGKLMLGAMFLGTMQDQSANAQQQAPGFFELRIYTAVPGKRDALAQRFIQSTAAIYARHGITNVGYWIPQQSDDELGISAENTFIYIRGYPSKDERDKRLKAAHDDPEFHKVVGEQESNPATKLIVKAHNIDMVPSGPYASIAITK
jgi:hypothetical protein